jgi:alcohol dehydrogenase class IV
MEYSLIGAAEKFGRIAVALGEPTKGLTKMQKAKTSVEAVKKLMNDIDMPLGLAELGTKEEDIDAIAADALSSGMHMITPRKMDLAAITDLIKKAL